MFDRKRLWDLLRRVNWVLLGATLLLAAAGVAFVKSACESREEAVVQVAWVGQAQFAVLGVFLMAGLALWDYRRWVRLAPWAYGGILVALVLVLIPGIGEEIMGARRWLFGLQPSEPAKLAIIVLLAWLLGKGKAWMRTVRGLCSLRRGSRRGSSARASWRSLWRWATR